MALIRVNFSDNQVRICEALPFESEIKTQTSLSLRSIECMVEYIFH